MPTLFSSLAELGERLEATKKRKEMVACAAEFLRGLEGSEVEPAVTMLLGRAFPKTSERTLEVSWAIVSKVIKRLSGGTWEKFGAAYDKAGDIGTAVRSVLEGKDVIRQATLFAAPLSIAGVRAELEALSESGGQGTVAKKERIVEALMSGAAPVEAKYIVRILIGEMRTGFSEGLMEVAIAEAFGAGKGEVKRAAMALGDIGETAALLKAKGPGGLSGVSIVPMRAVSPMLAQPSEGVAEALAELVGSAAFEYKYDAARVQIHKQGDRVRIFSRRLTDITESLPEVAERVRTQLKSNAAIIEGEAVAVDKSGTPVPFQHLMRRLRRVHDLEESAERLPITLYLFDALYVDGASLLDRGYIERRRALTGLAGGIRLADQLITGDAEEAERFLKASLGAGHEGLVAKKLDSRYMPGARGKLWLKVKPVLDPLDLVIVGAEWGYGRRHGWLSDYRLAARDEATGGFVEVGKTFKGLTDAEMQEMTKRLLEITVERDRRGVKVVPKVVVEVIYNEVQESPTYKSGMALRFARISRIRSDKGPDGSDTIQRVRAIYEGQFSKKGAYRHGQEADAEAHE